MTITQVYNLTLSHLNLEDRLSQHAVVSFSRPCSNYRVQFDSRSDLLLLICLEAPINVKQTLRSLTRGTLGSPPFASLRFSTASCFGPAPAIWHRALGLQRCSVEPVG